MNRLKEKLDATAKRTYPLVMQGGEDIHKLALYTAVLHAMDMMVNTEDEEDMDKFIEDIAKLTSHTKDQLQAIVSVTDAIARARL